MHRRALLRSASAAVSFAVLPRLALAAAASAPKSAFAKVRDRYFLEALRLNPVSATYLGGDGLQPSHPLRGSSP